eukprot:1827906-Alexandrium_andersonii.AAC.1
MVQPNGAQATQHCSSSRPHCPCRCRNCPCSGRGHTCPCRAVPRQPPCPVSYTHLRAHETSAHL